MKPISPVRRIRLKGGIPIKYFMVLLLALSLAGCSLENADEGFANEGPSPFTDEEMLAYADEHQIEIPSILNTADYDYAAILGEGELHQLYKGENDEMVSEVKEFGLSGVEFGSLNSLIYVVIRDEDLLENGERLEIIKNGGVSSISEIVRIEDSFFTLHGSGREFEGSVTDAQMIIYDSEGNSIYEQDLEN